MKNFEEIVKPLLRSLNIEPLHIHDEQCFIELRDGLKVNMLCNWSGSVVLAANLGGLKKESSELLWNLLEENLFCELPQIQISAAAADKKIIIWTQEKLNQLDTRSLTILFRRLVSKANEIKALLSNSDKPNTKIGLPAMTKSRLRNFPI